MKKSFIYLSTAIAALLVAFGVYTIDQKASEGHICSQEYALCTSAPCIPDPQDPKKSICFCTVQQGKSFGNASCAHRKPYTDKFGVRFVTSDYSFAEYHTKKTMICPDGKPWSFCLDKKCTVDPKDPTRAICTCDVLHAQKFVTLGGNCDKATCDTAYWSGATLDEVNTAMSILSKAFGMQKGPENYCPDDKPS